MKGNFKKMLGKKFAKVMSIFLSCAIALSSFAPVAYATDGVETVSDQVRFNCTYDWDFSGDNCFTVLDNGTAQIGVTLSAAPAGYHYEFHLGSYNPTTGIIVPDSNTNGALQAIPSDDSGTQYKLVFDGQKLSELEKVKEYGYIFFATALVDDTTGEIESSQGFDVFVSVEETEQTPVTHNVSHEIYMGSGNMCEVPSVGATADVKIGDVFAVRFFDNNEQIPVEKVTVSQEGLTAAGIEIANQCGCGHIDFRITDAAKLGAKILYFTVTLDDGTVMYPEVVVQIVSEETGDTTDGEISLTWHLVGSGEVEYDLGSGMDAAVDITGDTSFYITMKKGSTVLIPTAFETGDTDFSGTDGIYLDYGHEGSAVHVSFNEGLTNGQKLVKITNTEGDFWFYFNVTGAASGEGGNEGDSSVAVELLYLGGLGNQRWRSYTGDYAFEVWPTAYIGIRFKESSGTYVAAENVVANNLPEDIYSYTFTDGDGNEWNAIDFDGTAYGEYTLEYTVNGEETVHATFKVGEQHYFGETQPETENTFNGNVKLILGDEQDFTDSYHGTQQGSWTGIRFYTSDGTPIDYDKVSVESFGDDFSLYTTTSGEGYKYWDMKAYSEAKKGYHTVRFNVEGYGVYTLVLYVNEASGGNSGSDFPSHYYGSLEAALNDNADTFSGYMNSLTGTNDNPDVRLVENNFFGSAQGSMFGVEFWTYDEATGEEVQLTLGDIGIDFVSDHLEIRMDENAVYGGIDVWVDDNAMNGYHVVMFDINGAKQPLVVGVMSGSGSGTVEDTFTGKVLIAPQVNGDGTIPESPIPWWSYNEMGDMSGNCFKMPSDTIFGVMFQDENNEVISPENVQLVTEDHSLMEFANLPYDYRVFYLGDRSFIGEKQLTFKINDQYKTIRVVSEYAVITEWQNPVEERTTTVIFNNYNGYFSREFTEEHGTVIVQLEGENTLICNTGSPVIKTAGDLMFTGSGDLTVNYGGNENQRTAIEVGGGLTVEGYFNNTKVITVNDIGSTKEVDGEQVTTYYGADVVVGEGHTEMWSTNLTVDGDLIINNAIGENWGEEVHLSWATITAENIKVNANFAATWNTVVNAKTITTGLGLYVAYGAEVNLTGEAEDRVGISANNINIVNGTVNVNGGMPMYHEDLGFMAAVYAKDELYIEHHKDMEENQTEPSLNVTTDVEQAYAVAVRNLSMNGGSLNINSEGANTTALYTYGNAEAYDYGVAIHSGNVNIVSNGYGILSDKDIQFGNHEVGAANVNIAADNGYALAVDPMVGGHISLENAGIVLKGSEGAISARYYPTSTDSGWWDFSYNENIWVKAGTSADDATVMFENENILGCTYIETADPDEDAKVTVTFETYGAMHAVKPVTKVTGNYYGVLPVPVKMGYRFAGWTTDPEGLDYLADTRVPGEDHTLYATWVEGEENTLYFDGFDSSHFEIPYSFFINYYEDALTVEFDGYNVIKVPERAFNTAALTFNGADGATMIINTDNHYNNVIYSGGKLTFNGKASYMIDGRIMSSNGIEFNNCEVDIYTNIGETALHSVAWGYNATGDIVVNKGAIVNVTSEGGAAVLADGANIIVNNGGALGAGGKTFGAQATKSTYGQGGKISVAKGGSLVAMGDKAAMNAETYSLVTAKKMVAGFVDSTAKAVKSYNNERFFSIGDYAEVGSEVITDMVVNGEWFNSAEEYQGNGFYYVPNTTFNGKEGQNVIYFDYFCFTDYSDIAGINALIFSPVDVVLTSIPENQYGSVTDTEIDYSDDVYLIYSLGDVNISNFETGEFYLDVRAEQLVIDNGAYLKADNLEVNKDLTTNESRLNVSGTMEVKGNATFEGINGNNDMISVGSEFNYSASAIHGDLKVLGTSFSTANNLRVFGDVLVSSGSLTARSYLEEEYSQTHLIVDGNINVMSETCVDADHITCKDLTVEEFGDVDAGRISAENLTVKGGEVYTDSPQGYSSLSVNSTLKVTDGYVEVHGGIATYLFDVSGGEIFVTDAANGIDLGKMNMTGGIVRVGEKYYEYNEEYDYYYDAYTVTTHGIILRSYGTASVINITDGQLDICAGDRAIYITKGRKATINTSGNKYNAKVRLEGNNGAVYTGGTLTAYGDLTAGWWYDGLETVKKYEDQRLLYVNVKTHYNVTFHHNNGAEDDVIRIRLDEYAWSIDSEREGYSFTGWYTDKECTQLYDWDKPVTNDVDLYAGWKANEYPGMFVSNTCEHEGEHDKANVPLGFYNFTFGQPFGELPTPEELGYVRLGHKFVGWSYTADGSNGMVSADDIVTEIPPENLYAIWELENFEYTLNANGGAFVFEDEGKAEVTAEVPYYCFAADYLTTTPSRPLYNFTGWYCDEAATQPFDAETRATENVTLYAGWECKYTVSDVVATIVPGDAERTEMTVVYWPADNSEITEEHFNLGVKLGDRIVLETETNDAEIWYALLNTEQELTDDSYKLYTGAIEITKDMLPETGADLDGELVDAFGLFVYATKADYNESALNNAIIIADTDRNEWGDVLEEDRAEFNDALDVPDYMWVANVPAEVEYTGTAVKVDDIRVYDNKTLLELGKDYTATYASNTNAGTAKITVRGKGNYADALEKIFTITPMEIDGTAESGSTFEAQLNATVKTVTTGVQKPVVKFVKDGKALVNNKDYTVTFEMYDETADSWNAVAGPKEVGQYRVVITGKGNYSGVVYADYRITANVLADKFTVTGVKPANYTGNAVVQPDMVVKQGAKVLVEGEHYTVAYENNVNVGKATVVITAVEGSGYEGTKVVTFDIKGTKLTANMLKGFAANVAYNGGEHTQTGIRLENKGVELLVDKDYTVTYENNTAAGTATMTVTGKGGYYGEVTKTFTIGTKVAATMLKDFKATLKYFEAVNENGYVEQPVDKLVYNGTDLIEGTDYRVNYTYNDKAGKATVVYEGIGAYYGTFNKTFTITATAFAAKSMAVENWTDTVKYTGELVELSGYELYFDGTLLTEGVDYTVTYKNNLKAGKATVTFKGMKGYSGQYTKQFTIGKATLDDVTVDMPAETAYTKGGTTPEPVITYGDIVLKKGTDYTVTYKNQTKPGTATATIKLKGNFDGTVVNGYEIVKADLGNVTVTAADVVFKDKVTNYTSTVKLVDTNNKPLAAGTDYDRVFVYTYEEDVQLANGVVRHYGDTVGAKDKVPAGTTIRVTVFGKGYYEGETSATYRVTQGTVATAAVTIEAQNYTGNPVGLDKNQITVKAGGVELGYEDYEIIGYENNIKIGTAKVTIKGVGNYGGTKTVTFRIQAKSAKTVIKFVANGGTGNIASVNVMNDDVTLTSIFNSTGKQTLTRKGYEFAGWNTEKDGSGVHYDNAGTFYASDRGNARTIRLYAQWQRIEYTITYVGVDDAVNTNPETYNVDTATFKLANPEKEGFKFEGWFTNANLKAGKTTQVAKGSTGDKVFYAKWKQVACAALGHSEGGTCPICGAAYIPGVCGIAGHEIDGVCFVCESVKDTPSCGYVYHFNSEICPQCGYEDVFCIGLGPGHEYNGRCTVCGATNDNEGVDITISHHNFFLSHRIDEEIVRPPIVRSECDVAGHTESGTCSACGKTL